MKANYPYPKNEFEFYSREYSIEQLIENYDVSNLMEYYLFGMNCIKKMNTIPFKIQLIIFKNVYIIPAIF